MDMETDIIPPDLERFNSIIKTLQGGVLIVLGV